MSLEDKKKLESCFEIIKLQELKIQEMDKQIQLLKETIKLEQKVNKMLTESMNNNLQYHMMIENAPEYRKN